MATNSFTNSMQNSSRLSAGIYQGPIISPSVQQGIVNSVSFNSKKVIVDNGSFIVGSHKMGSIYKVTK